MAVEVYWWPPKKALNKSTGQEEQNIGHAAIKSDGGSPWGTEYLSVWPGSEWSLLLAGPASFHTADDDSGYGYDPVVVRLTKLDETAIKKRIVAIKTAGVYSLSVANCASLTGSALRAGVPFPTPYPWPNSPWAVYYYARSLTLFFA